MNTELRAALLASTLLEAEAAAAAVASGSQIELLGAPFVVSQLFVNTYEARVVRVLALEGEYWQRLAASTAEFVKNLRAVVGAELECATIKSSQQQYFVVFRLGKSGGVLGCIRATPGGDQSFLNANAPAA